MIDNAAMEKLKGLVKIKKLSSFLAHGRQAALITSETNIRYFTGFANSEGTMLIAKNKAVLLVDFRYGEAAKKKVNFCDVVVYNSLGDALAEQIKSLGLDEILLEASSVTVKRAASLSKIFRSCGCKAVTDDKLDRLIGNQRIIKSAEEIEKITKAQRITEEAYLELLNSVKVGAKEKDLALELEYLMRKKGASGVSFDLITICGAKTSMPHGVPGDEEIKRGDFVTFDIGAVYDGYHSDMTRTIAVGEVSDKQREVYELVLKAQLASLDKVKAGVNASEIDKTARDIITQAGYGENFKHSTGHGVGLEIHELPNVSQKSPTILSAGMVITVEPGVYIPESFGVRIEDMVVVTKNGCQNLAKLPKELIIV